MIIKKNKIGCMNCGDVIESKSVHDFVECACGSVAVDGGLEFLKRTGDQWVNLSESYDDDGNRIEPPIDW